MCHCNGSPFHKKFVNIGLIFYKNVPEHGSVFPKLCGKHPQILKNGLYFFWGGGESLKMGTFLSKWPLKMGRVWKLEWPQENRGRGEKCGTYAPLIPDFKVTTIHSNYTTKFKGVLHPRPVFGLFLHFSQKLQHIGNK